MRKQEYYEEIDLYKFKANWCKKKVYELKNCKKEKREKKEK